MNTVKYNDVRQKQLDCIQYILHRYGDQIGESWRRIIEIIGAIDSAIRLVFSVFVVFLLPLPCRVCEIILLMGAHGLPV